MATFNVTKDYTVNKVKTDVKANAMEDIFTAMADKYGEDNVAWVRTGGQSPKNEIAVCVGTADVEGDEVPVCFTISASAKDFVDRKTDKKTFTAFDFSAGKAAYENYVAEKSEKDAAKAKAKAEKIAKDEAKRSAEQGETFGF